MFDQPIGVIQNVMTQLIEHVIDICDKKKEKLLVWVYYTGHTYEEDDYSLILNGVDNQVYPIERVVERLSHIKGAHVIQINDGTRIKKTGLTDKATLIPDIPGIMEAAFKDLDDKQREYLFRRTQDLQNDINELKPKLPSFCA